MLTTNPLEDVPVLVIFAVFAVISFIAYEIGFQIGHWYQARSPGVQEGPTGVLVGSILALLAFLLAITMGMASDRFDTRRGLVLEEANAIQTTYLRAGYLPEPASSETGTCCANTCRCAPTRPMQGRSWPTISGRMPCCCRSGRPPRPRRR